MSLQKYEIKTIYFSSVALGLTISLILHYFTVKEIFENAILFLIPYCLLRAIYCFLKAKERGEK